MSESQQASPISATPVVVARVEISELATRSVLQYGLDYELERCPPLTEWGAATEDQVTSKVAVEVVEFGEDQNMSFKDMFRSLDLSAVCLTKSQIAELITKEPGLLRPDAPLFALFRHNGKFFVTKAVSAEVIRLVVLRFEDDRGWIGRLKPRVILPVIS
ncbi:MAG: hypothetical protein WCO21_00935 [bacterium]